MPISFFLNQSGGLLSEIEKENISVQLYYCTAAGHNVLLSHLTTICVHFALHLRVDTFVSSGYRQGAEIMFCRYFLYNLE